MLVRCQHYKIIPKTLSLLVEDRSFTVPIEIDSWEEANPILLGEDTDRHLGLDTAEAQDHFIKYSGFRCIPKAARLPGSSTGFSLDPEDFPRLAPGFQPIASIVAQPPPGPSFPPGLTSGPAEATLPADSASSSTPAPLPAPTPSTQVCDSVFPLLAPSLLAVDVAPPPPEDSEPCRLPGLGLSPPLLDLELRRIISNVGPLVDRPDPAMSATNRRSVRLAAKCRGAKKSSLTRAQDLMCRKLKMVRFSARATRLSSHSASSSSSLSALPRLPTSAIQPVASGAPLSSSPAVDPVGPSGGVDATRPKADLLDPLTPGEVRAIREACGITAQGIGPLRPWGVISGGE